MRVSLTASWPPCNEVRVKCALGMCDESSKACKWYDARELLDPAEWSANQVDPMSQLLATSLQALSSPSPRLRNEPNCHESPLGRRFKPIHQAEGAQEIQIFRSRVTRPHGGDACVPTDLRNVKSAEALLQLQHKLFELIKRASNMDERLRQIEPQLCPGQSAPQDSANDECDTAGPLGARFRLFWPPLFWFAWPLALLTALNRCWPLPIGVRVAQV